jgi:MFS family permease
MRRGLSRNVYLLGLLSFFNDFSSDMISPLLPAFLGTLGMGAVFLGWMEGLANSLSHVTALLSGWLDDRHHQSKRWTVAGYSLCAFIRPLFALGLPPVIVAVRLLDRIGKGIRTAPRDHLLTDSIERSHWGRGFGVQRSMDHLGALVGPPIAALLLGYFSVPLPWLFAVAALPAILSVLIVPRMIREPEVKRVRPAERPLSWRQLPKPFRRYLLVIFLIALSTPSELFLFLKLQEMGFPAYQQSLGWALLTAATMLAATLGGILSDYWSERRVMALGWALFAAVFVAIAYNQAAGWTWALLAVYGLQSGLVESSERTYPARMAPPAQRATMIGWYYFAYGAGMLPASVLFGWIWARWSPSSAFLAFAAMTLLTIPMLLMLPSSGRGKPEETPWDGAALR